MILAAPPTEETLLQNTLWPEVHKLYGHGYELFALAADPQCELLVSTSRAQQAEHSCIFVWNEQQNWSLVDRLNAHTLTVTQMSFAPDGRRLVSVSRDRTWALHEKCQVDGKLTLKTVAKGSGGSRILWTCDWSPDSRYFVTGSRDKRVIVWNGCDSDHDVVGQPLECGDSVTAVAFCPLQMGDGAYVLAVGLDCGQVLIYSWRSSNWSLLYTLNQRYLN